MSSESPDVCLYDIAGNPLAVQNATAIPANTSAILFAGSDGTNSRYILLDSSGREIVVGAGTAGTPAGGVITIQGVSGGTVIPITGGSSDNTTNSTTKVPTLAALANTSAPTWTNGNMVPLSVDTAGNLRITGTISASNPSVGTNNAAIPSSSTLVGGSDGTNLRPLVTDTTGRLNNNSFITSPNNQLAGIYAFPTPYGTLQVSNEPSPLFSDAFSGTTIDTINRWITPIVSGVGASVTQNSGSLVLTASTTANSYASITSQATFVDSGLGFIILGIVVKIEAVAVTGQEKFWGLGTLAAAPTNTAALTDAIGFEQDTTGVLSAVIYSAGTKIFSQTLTRPTDGNNHTYVAETRPDVTLFYIDNLEVPSASIQYTSPSNQSLPFHLHIVNGPTPSGAGTFQASAAGMGDSAPGSISISDGNYGWRKIAIKPPSTAASISDNSLVVSVSPNSPTLIGFDNIVPRNVFVDSNGRQQVQDDNNRYILEQVVNNQKSYGDLFIDVLSYIRNYLSSSLPSSSTGIGNVVYGNANQPITCTLNSLANNGQRQSTAVNNSANYFTDALVQIQVKTNAASTSATGIVNIYVYSSSDGGVTFGDGASGVDNAITLTAPPNITLIGSINTVANATVYKSNVMSVIGAFAGNLPQYWGIVVENKSGAALDSTATNFKTFYQGIIRT